MVARGHAGSDPGLKGPFGTAGVKSFTGQMSLLMPSQHYQTNKGNLSPLTTKC